MGEAVDNGPCDVSSCRGIGPDEPEAHRGRRVPVPTTGGIGVVDVDMPWDAGAAAKGALQGQFAFDCGTSAQPCAVIWLFTIGGVVGVGAPVAR